MADVCLCQSVSDEDIRRAAAEGARDFEELRIVTGCSGGCGACEEQARQLFSEATAEIAMREPGLVPPIESAFSTPRQAS